MLKNCCYNKTKIIYTLSKLSWFIEKHAQRDAQNTNNAECLSKLHALQNDIEKHLQAFNQERCAKCNLST